MVFHGVELECQSVPFREAWMAACTPDISIFTLK